MPLILTEPIAIKCCCHVPRHQIERRRKEKQFSASSWMESICESPMVMKLGSALFNSVNRSKTPNNASSEYEGRSLQVPFLPQLHVWPK